MIKLEITLDPRTGQVTINAPLQDKILCLGVLAMAERLVHEYDPARQPKPGILLAQQVPSPLGGR